MDIMDCFWCLFYKQNHYFEVVALISALLGAIYYWWIDPSGAIALAIYTLSNWSGTVLNPSQLQTLLFEAPKS
ncbi:Metal tolerance protein 4 [Bienertia sinuspersici]